jgi:hypothetical protein
MEPSLPEERFRIIGRDTLQRGEKNFRHKDKKDPWSLLSLPPFLFDRK